MREKLDAASEAVNAGRLILALCLLAACGPSPRPVTADIQRTWNTPLGNTRRAPFENERVPDRLDVAWDIDAGSGMRASPIVTDSTVFVGTTNRQLLAYATRTGRRYWDQRVEGSISSSLVLGGRTLYATTAEWNGRLHARSVERGRRVWRRDIGPTRHSPLLEGGILYAANDAGRVHAVRSEDGEQIWRINVPGPIATTPVSFEDVLIVATAGDSVYRVNKRDGAIQRRAHIESTPSAPPALHDGLLVFATHGGVLLGVDANTLETRWRAALDAPILAAPAISSDGIVHVVTRNATLWRVTNGSAVKVADLDGAVTTSFTVAQDRYIIGMVDGTLVITDRDGRVVTEHKFNDSVSAPVVVHDGALYVPLLRGRIVKMRQAQ